MTIKALVLDLDGALYRKRSERLADLESRRMAHVYLKKKNILQKMPKSEIKKMDIAMEHGSVTVTLRSLSKKHHMNLKEVERFAYDIDPTDFGIKKDPQLVRILTALSKRYSLAIFSNGYDPWVMRVLEVLGINHLIKKNMIVSPERLHDCLKPEAKAFRTMLKIVRFKENEIIFIDDNPSNIREARRLGIRSILTINKGRNKRDSIHSILMELNVMLK